MADVALSLSLDDEGAVYSPGGQISGSVGVRVDGDCPCQGLSVALVLRMAVHGTPPTEQSGATAHVLEGRWSPGEHRHPFTLRVPSGPSTHPGAHLVLGWELVVSPTVCGPVDPTVRRDVTIRPAEVALAAPAATGGPADVVSESDATSHAAEVGRGVYVVLAIALLAAIGGIPLYLAYDVVEPLAGGGTVSGVILALLALRFILARRSRNAAPGAVERIAALTGRPQLRVEPVGRDAYRGSEHDDEAIACTFWVKPDCPPLRVTATLAVAEEVEVVVGTHRRGKIRENYLEPLHQREAPLTAADEPGTYVGRIALPTGVPGSFERDGAAIRWRLTAVYGPLDGSWTASREVTLQVQ